MIKRTPKTVRQFKWYAKLEKARAEDRRKSKNEVSRIYFKEHPEKARAYRKKFYDKHRDKISIHNNKRNKAVSILIKKHKEEFIRILKKVK